MTHWTDRAAALAEGLVVAGRLRSPEWITAVAAIPRHALVPVFYEQDPHNGDWLTRDGTDPAGHDQIYANRALFHQDRPRHRFVGHRRGRVVLHQHPGVMIAQTRVGGLILADLKLSVHAGNLVLLRRHPDRAEGRFDRTWAGFMALRHTGGDTARLPAPNEGESPARSRAHAARRTSDLEQLRPWDNLVAWFLAQLSVSIEIGYGHTIDEQTGHPGNVLLTSGDGSWCEVGAHTEGGARQVWEAGPIPLWRVVENAHHLWTTLGRPGWDRFGLTATADQQWIWLDTPDSSHTWPLHS